MITLPFVPPRTHSGLASQSDGVKSPAVRSGVKSRFPSRKSFEQGIRVDLHALGGLLGL